MLSLWRATLPCWKYHRQVRGREDVENLQEENRRLRKQNLNLERKLQASQEREWDAEQDYQHEKEKRKSADKALKTCMEQLNRCKISFKRVTAGTLDRIGVSRRRKDSASDSSSVYSGDDSSSVYSGDDSGSEVVIF
ncbi:uncharacterized protein RCC_07153 [Ramularia collo-cygni]|uniref:Uncharacterized protein n=1 Tax=Ramularia collo-cygni TaxID=112498 RepID=A0A2D3V765_9PEZI|nr:uncharacterized protein RCC_07153 [Ramularia collo-cygni]CZT21290.1 uncharacterized protein RCC_07153 [Ramularia collo-cygni]